MCSLNSSFATLFVTFSFSVRLALQLPQRQKEGTARGGWLFYPDFSKLNLLRSASRQSKVTGSQMDAIFLVCNKRNEQNIAFAKGGIFQQ